MIAFCVTEVACVDPRQKKLRVQGITVVSPTGRFAYGLFAYG